MSTNKESQVVIVSACRTAIGKFGGALSTMPAPQLGGVVVREALRRAGLDPAAVDEVMMGNVVSAGLGQAPARQAAIAGGLPAEGVRATAINKVCGSSLKAVMLGAAMIRAGDAEIIVAGGMENMNMCPYLLARARTGYRMGHGELIDSMISDGLWCAFENHHMGSSAEWIARAYNITRQAQDEYAYHSHQKAIAAQDTGKFKAEIVAVEIPAKKGPPTLFEVDECPRRDTSLEALARLKPAFEPSGSVTAGNAPGITDGAAAVVIMSLRKAEQLGITPLGRITGYDQAGVKPMEIFSAPIFAVRRLMDKAGRCIDDYDLIEANEAFAAQCLADGQGLGWDAGRVNVNGGAIALGHPIGASGTRVLVTLLYALQDHGLKSGLATLCLGGGEAVALSIERM
ncbi:MAG: acetyl-CoA C-acetyltransferase [Thermoflexales bacterium]|nr:acetyl-CoA C-acetyltransferase [Thermoflexales bacterium]